MCMTGVRRVGTDVTACQCRTASCTSTACTSGCLSLSTSSNRRRHNLRVGDALQHSPHLRSFHLLAPLGAALSVGVLRCTRTLSRDPVQSAYELQWTRKKFQWVTLFPLFHVTRSRVHFYLYQGYSLETRQHDASRFQEDRVYTRDDEGRILRSVGCTKNEKS